MAQFSVDADSLIATRADLSQGSERLRGDVAYIMGRVTQLEGSWQGQASQAFQGLAAEWRALHAQVEQALDDLAHRLQVAGTGYQQVEHDVANMFR